MLFDKEFKNTASHIGIAMIIMLCLITPFLVIFGSLISTASYSIFSPEVAYTLYRISYGILYSLVFFIPLIIFRLMNKDVRIRPIGFRTKLPKSTPLIILASVTIIFCASQINGILISFFDFADTMQDTLTPTEKMKPYEIVLAIFTTAIIPGIFEELLFRGTVLSNLLPYGKTFAIVSSAILFGLMHENPAQIFYTVIAGIVLGYAYTKTNSIVCVILIHFTNNLFGVFQSVLLANLDQIVATRIFVIFEAILFVAGAASIIYFIIKSKSKKDVYSTGCFEVIVESTPDYIQKPTSFEVAKKFFLSTSVLIFTIAAIGKMIILLIFPSFIF